MRKTHKFAKLHLELSGPQGIVTETTPATTFPTVTVLKTFRDDPRQITVPEHKLSEGRSCGPFREPKENFTVCLSALRQQFCVQKSTSAGHSFAEVSRGDERHGDVLSHTENRVDDVERYFTVYRPKHADG